MRVSSMMIAGLLIAPAIDAQSTHLARLEIATPATAAEPLGTLAWAGWSGTWVVPATGRSATGVLVGVERESFASISSTLAAVRLRVGPVWQLTFAQISVTDLFDPELLAEIPELGTLNVSATQLGLDAVISAGSRVAFSLGGRYERDELLGDARTAWIVRPSAHITLPLRVTLAGCVERAFAATGAGTGRLTVGAGRRFSGGRVDVDWGLGARVGDVWRAAARQRAVASAVRVTMLDRVSLTAAIGTERPAFGPSEWLGFATFGLGLRVGPIGADIRRGGQGDAQAWPTALSVLFKK